MSSVTPSPNEPPLEVELQTVWPTDIASDAVPINQCIFTWDQQNREIVYMALGHIGPPMWANDAIAHRALTELNGEIPIKARGSYVLSRSRAVEIYETLGKHLGILPVDNS